MAGQRVPLILLPRYSTYAGVPITTTGTIGVAFFSTIAMDVTPYSSASVAVWRGKLVGSTTPGITFAFQESMDGVNWTTIGSTFDPTENVEEQKSVTITKRYLRITVLLGGADNVC